MAAPPLPSVLDPFGERWPHGVQPAVKILVDPDKMSPSGDKWVIHQLVAPRFFAARLRDATHVLLDPDLPVTALKLAQYAAYDQHALVFDWAIDGARGRLEDRAERDYKIRAAPVVQPSVKVEPAVAVAVVEPRTGWSDVQRGGDRPEAAVRVAQPSRQGDHPKASQLPPPPASVGSRVPANPARGSASVTPAAPLAPSQVSARPSALATVELPRPPRSSAPSFAPALLPRLPSPPADAAPFEQLCSFDGWERVDSSSESEDHRSDKNAPVENLGPARSSTLDPSVPSAAETTSTTLAGRRQREVQASTSPLALSSRVPSPSSPIVGRQPDGVEQTSPGLRLQSDTRSSLLRSPSSHQLRSTSQSSAGPSKRLVESPPRSSPPAKGKARPHAPTRPMSFEPAFAGTNVDDALGSSAPSPQRLSRPTDPRLLSSSRRPHRNSFRPVSQSAWGICQPVVSSRSDADDVNDEDPMALLEAGKQSKYFSQSKSKRKQSVDQDEDSQEPSGQSAAKRQKPAPPKKRKPTKAEVKAERAERARKRKERAAEDKAALAQRNLDAEDSSITTPSDSE